VPGPADRIRVSNLLVQLANNGDTEAAGVGIDLVRMWVHIDPMAMNEHLALATLTLACQPVPVVRGLDLHTWREVLQLLSPFHPRQVAQLIVGRMTDPNAPGGWSDEENVDVLIRSA